MEFTPTSTSTPKRKGAVVKTPKAPKKPKLSAPAKLFNDRINQWKKANSILTEVEITKHCDPNLSKGYFIMLRQRSLMTGGKQDNAVLVHHSYIRGLVQNLNQCLKVMENNKNNASSFASSSTLQENTAQFEDTIPLNTEKKVEHELGTKENPIVVDEWDINSVQSFYRKELTNIYFEKMKGKLRELIQGTCEGCCFAYPSQRDHECFTLEPLLVLEVYFNKLIDMVDEDEANKECLKIANNNQFKYAGNVHVSNEELKNDDDWKQAVKSLFSDYFEENN